MSAGFSTMQQFVQTTLPKRVESSLTFKAQVPFPAKSPGEPVAVVVAVTLEVVREAVGELVALMLVVESFVLMLPNFSSDLRVNHANQSGAGRRKDVPQKAERVTKVCVNERQRTCEFVGAPDYKISNKESVKYLLNLDSTIQHR